MNEIFYFLCHPKGDKTRICVIDEQESLHYEKYDFSLVNDMEWDNSEEAIDYAKKLAVKYDLVYEEFENRCGEKIHKSTGLYL